MTKTLWMQKSLLMMVKKRNLMKKIKERIV